MFKRWTRIACIAFGLSVLVACEREASPGPSGPRLLGISAGSLSSVTTAPGGCVMSLLFDSLRVEWNNGGTAPRRMPATHFALVGGSSSANSAIRLTFKGHATPGANARIRIDVDGRQIDLQATGEDFDLTADAKLSGDSADTLVRVTLDLPQPANSGTAAIMALDSIDIIMPDCRSSEGGEGNAAKGS